MSQRKVSVIIPAYNRGRYIRQTVESVLNQTYTNIELIVIDDGSTDDTRDVLEGYGDRIIMLEHEGRQNRGQSASINLGLDHASGEYLAILDSDDYWEPDKIESQVGYLQQHPQAGLVYGNGTAVNERGEFLYNIYPRTHREESKPEKVLLDCYFSLPSNALMRKSLLKKTGYFDETLRAGQDHDMAIRIAEVVRLAYIDKPLFHYRRHNESISRSNKGAVSRWSNGFIILEKARIRYPYPPVVIRKRKAVLYFRLFQCAWENSFGLRALRNLLMAGLNDPARALGVLLRREKTSSPH